jgi:hypothetical protein
MRAIDHAAGDGNRARVRLRLECGNDGFGVPHFLFGGGEGGVDDWHLRGMDRKLADEAFPACRLGLAPETLFVFEIREDSVDWLDTRGDRTGKAERSR